MLNAIRYIFSWSAQIVYDTQVVHCMRKRYSLRYFDSITTIQCGQRLFVDF